MDLRELVAQEAAALLADTLGGYIQRTSADLHLLRDVIDTLDGSLKGGRASAASAAERFAGRLHQAARAEVDAAVAAARHEADAAIAQMQAALTARHEDAAREARAERDRLTRSLEQATKDHAAVSKRAEAAQFERDASRREASQIKKQLDAAAAEHSKLVAALDKAKTLLKDTETERRSLAGQLGTAVERLETVERDNEELEGVHLTLHARLEAAAATVATLNPEVEEAHGKAARAKRDADTAAQASSRDQFKKMTQVRMHKVVTILQKIGTSSAVSDTLGALVEGLATEFSRVALFRVNGSRLEGVHQVRLDFESDISNVAIPLTMDSLLAQAVASGQIEGLPASELADRGGAPFGGTPAFVLAMPVIVGDSVAAVIYADDSDQPDTSDDATTHKRTFAELLWAYAAPRLATLSAEVKDLTELRNYATLLLDEIEYVYQADDTAGRRGDDLRRRLADNLECARRIYAQRVASDGPAARGLLDEQLKAMTASKADTGFGEDLLAVSRQPSLAGDAANQDVTAEAS